RPYSLGCATVGALYERPRCIFCAKPGRGGRICRPLRSYRCEQIAQGLCPGLMYCRRFVVKLADIMRIFWTIATLLLAAMPLLAQDDAPSPPFAGGGGGAQVFTRVDSVNP